MMEPMGMIPRADEQDGDAGAGASTPTVRRLGAEEAGQDEAEAEDDEADLAGHDADGGHARAGGEAVGLRLGPRVADHDRGAQGGGRQERPVGDAGGLQRGDDADVDDDLAARSKTLSMNAPSGLAWPVARASVPSNMSKTPPMKTTMPPTSHSCWLTRIGARRR